MRFKKKLLVVVSGLLFSVYLLLIFFAHFYVNRKYLKEPETERYKYMKKISRQIQDNKNDYFMNKFEGCEHGNLSSQADIQIFKIYNELKFDNIDGGVWKQGWNVQISKNRWNSSNKLKIFVVPHSHNDPGWKKTFEQYYASHTRNIFNNMVTKLSEDSRRKFIWAEVSFLSLWWIDISQNVKRKFQELVDSGQVEIVSGGWVMPDEANSHYYSIIQQLTHGHQWLKKHLNYKPKHSWCIDPFGTSPTLPYILQHFGLESLVIQRTHYSIKKYLAKNKQLEFRWRQLWDSFGKYDFMTHMTPFYSYDIPHTCGPDPAVCCQFDFRRSSYSGMTCPWKKQPQMITERNIAFRAEILLDQYRKKAELYSTNVLLVPLGDDFRYDVSYEWDQQFNNYQKLFDYMNNNPSLYVEVNFGTLQDYFESLKNEKLKTMFPSLSGDFFTYADRDDHYWSGYYTSKPYYKQMDRELISYLRSAEILHAIAWKSAPQYSDWLISEKSNLVSSLRNAREGLSLFQHHDGITGTAKEYVVDDYGRKLEQGMKGAQHVMQQALNFILNADKSSYQPDLELVYFELKESRKTSDYGPEKIIKINEFQSIRKIVIFNSLTWNRKEILSLKIENYVNIELYDENNELVPYQINPFCELTESKKNCFLLYFKTNIEPLSIKMYFLKFSAGVSNTNNLASLTILNGPATLHKLQNVKNFLKEQQIMSDFSLQNNKISVTFRREGLMKAITLKDLDLTVSVHLNFIKYTCKKNKEMCGAYLFLPEGRSRDINCEKPLVKIIEGKLISSVIVYCDFVVHAVNVYNCSGFEEHSIEIQNLVDIKTENNFEIAMKISTGIKSKGIFYTDLNGFQIIKRQYYSKLPLQGNYYPMSSSTYIEDENVRLTLVSAQPLGASSLNEGELEVMQDRRLSQDDNLGLGEGVLDNRPILHIFRLSLEKRIPNCHKVPKTHTVGYLSMISYLAMNSVLYPLMLFIQTDEKTNQNKLYDSYYVPEIINSSNIDVHLVSMVTIPESVAVGFVLHKTDLDTCFFEEYENYSFNNGLVNVSSFFPSNVDDVLYQSSLSFVQIKNKHEKNKLYPMCAMEFAAFYVTNNSVNIPIPFL